MQSSYSSLHNAKVQKTIQHIFLISREFAQVCSILFNHVFFTESDK